MTTQKPILFIGQAIMLDSWGEKETGKVYYTTVRLHRNKDNYFGHVALFLDIENLLKIIKPNHEKGSFAKITFEPPTDIDFRVNSNSHNGTPRKYEALSLEDINTVQRVLDLI